MAKHRARVGFAVLFLGAVTFGTSPLASSTGLAHASPAAIDSDDHYQPANATVTGRSNSVKIAIPPTTPVLTWTCTNSLVTQKTPATGLGTFKITPPTFNDGPGKPCADNLGFTDTVVSGGVWKARFIDARNDEASPEPNSGDRLMFIIPMGGVVVTGSEGCTITFAPTAPLKAIGTYDDVNTFTIIGVVPIAATGAVCPLGPGVNQAAFSVTYTLSPGLSDAS
jgi:hypothetical protein